MTGIAVLLAAAALAFALAKALRVPSVPLLLLAGFGLGQTGLLPQQALTDALILGVTFLLFVNGIELSPRRVRRQRRVAVQVFVVHFVVLAALGFAAATVLGMDRVGATYASLALTGSSTLVVVRMLVQRRQLFEPYARMTIGVLLLQDLLVMALMPVLVRAPEGTAAVAAGVGGVAALLLGMAAVQRWVTPLLVRLDGDDEALLLGVLAVLFVFIGTASALELPMVVGAFLAGVALSGFPASAVVRPQLASIGDFFSAVFFTALGALVGLPTPRELLQALGLAAVVVVATPPLVTFIAERAGLSARSSIEAGLLLAQVSELSLVVGLYGVLAGQITQGLFTVIALATLLTMLLTPLLASNRVAWWLLRLHPVRRERRLPIPTQGHVLILGSGTTGMPLLETLVGAGCEVVVVDDDPAVVAQLREAEIPVIRGDATDMAVLERANARTARAITSTVRRPEDNRRLLEHARGVPVVVRVFEERDAEWVREMGGIPVLSSHAAAEGLLRWMETQRRERPGVGDPASVPGG